MNRKWGGDHDVPVFQVFHMKSVMVQIIESIIMVLFALVNMGGGGMHINGKWYVTGRSNSVRQHQKQGVGGE